MISAGTTGSMSAMVAKAAVVMAAAGGLAAAFIVPLGPASPAAPREALRMPAASRETTISVFPAPGRPESRTEPLEPARPGAAPAPRKLVPRAARPLPGRPTAPRREPARAPTIRPQTDERLLAELGSKRPDDRSKRPLVAE